MLLVDTLSFSYRTTLVLSHITFRLDKGKHLAIMGESGSGKSTLLKAVFGLLEIDEGKVFWEGKELLGPNYNLVPGEHFIKYVSQDFDLMPFISVAENMAQEPQLLLLDEPFSNIDQFKKNSLRNRLFPYLKRKGVSVITASHDSADILSFADEILVLNHGKIEDHQPTELLYKNPKNEYVASLLGTENVLPIKLLKTYAELDASLF